MNLSTPHTCPELRLQATGITRHDLVTTGGWTPYTTMEPDEYGDWVRWEDVVHLPLSQVRQDPGAWQRFSCSGAGDTTLRTAHCCNALVGMHRTWCRWYDACTADAALEAGRG